MLKQYELHNKIYTVDYCTLLDLPHHIKKVETIWLADNVDFDNQRDILTKCIHNQTAFKVQHKQELAVIYYLPTVNGITRAYLGYTNCKTPVLLLGLYLRDIKNINKIWFIPHTGDFIPFRFAIEQSNIRNWLSCKFPLAVNFYSPKCKALYNKHLKGKVRVV